MTSGQDALACCPGSDQYVTKLPNPEPHMTRVAVCHHIIHIPFCVKWYLTNRHCEGILQ